MHHLRPLPLPLLLPLPCPFSPPLPFPFPSSLSPLPSFAFLPFSSLLSLPLLYPPPLLLIPCSPSPSSPSPPSPLSPVSSLTSLPLQTFPVQNERKGESISPAAQSHAQTGRPVCVAMVPSAKTGTATQVMPQMGQVSHPILFVSGGHTLK